MHLFMTNEIIFVFNLKKTRDCKVGMLFETDNVCGMSDVGLVKNGYYWRTVLKNTDIFFYAVRNPSLNRPLSLYVVLT